MKNYLVLGVALVFLGMSASAHAADQSQLTLGSAISLAMQNAPDIKGAAADYGAALGERRQAGALPNPSIGLEAENVAGSGPYNGIDGAELTFGVNQQILVGGKRSARVKAAESGKTMARYGQSTAALDLIRNVTVAFADAVAAQEQAVIMKEQVKLAKDVYATVNKRVTAAAEPVVQRNKAKISLANAELVSERATGQKDAAMKVLKALWNNAPSPATLSSKEFYKADKPTLDGDAKELLVKTADYKRQTAAVEQANSLLDLERANAIPDPVVSVGLRDLRTTNDQALVVGLSIPLPVFNMNGGNIQRAQQQAIKAGTDRQKTLLQGQAALAERQQAAYNAWLTATRIKNDILPEAQEAFRQAQRGYNAGKFAYLEVLDAQRTLTDTRITYIQALRDYHANKAEVERLTAQGDIFPKEVK